MAGAPERDEGGTGVARRAIAYGGFGSRWARVRYGWRLGTGQTGTWGIITLDFDEVVAHAAGQLTRSFTDEECRIYRIDPCPTLDEIRAGSA